MIPLRKTREEVIADAKILTAVSITNTAKTLTLNETIAVFEDIIKSRYIPANQQRLEKHYKSMRSLIQERNNAN